MNLKTFRQIILSDMFIEGNDTVFLLNLRLFRLVTNTMMR
jgi:hypothetical protein